MFDLSTGDNKELKKILHWTSSLEIGQTLSHNAYHRHSSYIIANSDMSGFTKREQTVMASLILGHTGKLPKVSRILNHEKFRALLICLRLAAIFSRSRVDLNLLRCFCAMKSKRRRMSRNAQGLDRPPSFDSIHFKAGDARVEKSWNKIFLSAIFWNPNQSSLKLGYQENICNARKLIDKKIKP